MSKDIVIIIIGKITERNKQWTIKAKSGFSKELKCTTKTEAMLKTGNAIRVWIDEKGNITNMERILDNKHFRIPRAR